MQLCVVGSYNLVGMSVIILSSQRNTFFHLGVIIYMAKIGIFLSSFGDGGAHKNMMHIAEWLTKQGHTVELIITKSDGPMEHAVPDNVSIYNLGSSRVRYSLYRFIKYFQKSEFDSILATPTTCTLIAGITDILINSDTKVTLRVPVTLSNERYYTNPKGIEHLFPIVTKYVYSKSESIIAISNGVKSDTMKTFDISGSNIKTIYNPAVTDDIFDKMKEPVEHPFFKEENKVFIAVGRLVEQKGFNTLINAFESVEKQTGAKLIILGDGKEKKNLVKLRQDLSLTDSVSFVGFVKNPYKYINNADVFVLSSLWEGFGNVVAEALACGTPVVATDCDSGPAEILDNGKYGKLVPVGDVNKLSREMVDVLDQEQNKVALVNRAKAFHIQNIGPQYEKEIL